MAATEVQFLRAARLQDLPPGRAREVRIARRRIVLTNDRGTVHAVQAACPHQGLPLDGGMVWEGALDCPWHHFQWDVRTGENIYPRKVYPLDAKPELRRQVRRLRTYPVRVVGDDVEVGVLVRRQQQP